MQSTKLDNFPSESKWTHSGVLKLTKTKDIQMDNWFSYDLEESKYQLGIYTNLLSTEKSMNGTHVSFYEEMISRLKSDIKKLRKNK